MAAVVGRNRAGSASTPAVAVIGWETSSLEEAAERQKNTDDRLSQLEHTGAAATQRVESLEAELQQCQTALTAATQRVAALEDQLGNLQRWLSRGDAAWQHQSDSWGQSVMQ